MKKILLLVLLIGSIFFGVATPALAASPPTDQSSDPSSNQSSSQSADPSADPSANQSSDTSDSTLPNQSANSASSKESVCNGLGLTGSSGSCTTDPGTPSVNHTLSLAINLFSLVVGIAAVFAIIFAGLRYITSGGESAKVSSAKDTILYAVVGLVVVALAQFIVKFVLTKVQTP